MNNKRIGDMSKDELIDYIIELDEENGRYERKLDKLQSNWNSLREYVEELYNKEGSWASCGARYILDKMNELEGKSNDN